MAGIRYGDTRKAVDKGIPLFIRIGGSLGPIHDNGFHRFDKCGIDIFLVFFLGVHGILPISKKSG
jgi:hypothetical protein